MFALKGAGKDKMVPFNYIYRIIKRERDQRKPVLQALGIFDSRMDPFVDEKIETEMLKESHKELIIETADIAI